MTASNNLNLDDRIRDALDAQAQRLTEADLRPATAPTGRRPAGLDRRWRWGAPLLAAAAVATIAIVTVFVSSPTAHRTSPATSPTPSVSVPLRPTSTSAPAPSSPSAGRSSSPSHSSAPSSAPPAQGSSFDLGYQPLYPFATLADALAWQAANRSGGHQPWHADAGQTAISFTTGWLGFHEIDTVTSTRTGADGAHVGVGYRNPNGALVTAAVLHLVRFGNGADSPWEVVGSDDDPANFSLDTPAYGSRVTSPMTVGGRILGVDENIKVAVRRLSSQAPVGSYCCTPAGPATPTGTDWAAPVSFTAAPGDVLTIVAQTGGHLQAVERFAIQGVHT